VLDNYFFIPHSGNTLLGCNGLGPFPEVGSFGFEVCQDRLGNESFVVGEGEDTKDK
jgi:hypothetical protein